VYALRRQDPSITGDVDGRVEARQLIGIRGKNGSAVRRESPVLSYCVCEETFASEKEMHLVADNVGAAARAWAAACAVRFEHHAALDGKGSDRGGVTFKIVGVDVKGSFIAAAFFPNDAADRRLLRVDRTCFDATLRFDKVGVFRHELGHVLGFRHEHIASDAPPDCPKESTSGTFPFTKYDPQSVMHYFCGGVGSEKLEITDVDVAGARLLYGRLRRDRRGR
jgi:hypothetical protein